MSSWSQRQKKWKRERQQQFNRTTTVDSLELEPSHPPPVNNLSENDPVPTSTHNYQHIISQPHHDSISVLRVRVNNRQFYFSGFPSGEITLLRGQSYIIDVSHPSNKTHQLVISRTTTQGVVNGIVSIGRPGNPGSFLALFIGNSRPSKLYYYCAQHRGMSGSIILQDPELE